jgi:deoxyribodipyrimidine photolyase-related protein
MPATLRLILGDQLHEGHSWWQAPPQPELYYVMMEMRQETDYVRHHVQKVLGFFAAMRHFAEARRAEGHQLIYLALDAPDNRQNLVENLTWLIEKFSIKQFEYQLPDEYRLDQQLKDFCKQCGIVTQAVDTEHFLTRREDLQLFFKGKKQYLMEHFYRHMRKEYQLLLDAAGQPLGGQWNFDALNREKYKGQVAIPPAKRFGHRVDDLLQMLQKAGVETIGTLAEQDFAYPINRQEALALLAHFTEYLLPHFGTYEDAMHSQEPFLFHSRLSFALNAKLLHPLEVCEQAIAAYQARPEAISLAQIEGFVRQIIGWREYMRGIYWAKMPEYAQHNFFEHQARLPAFYWTGQTQMHCLQKAIGQSLQEAYAHHIQRLMLTGNFALLLGVHPDEVDAWYLGIYIDAIEWVEITNTRGMSQYADGGLLATKPYTASANYIDKMSNYCGNCAYDKKKRYGEKACPFNSLYWDFHIRHREKLVKNPRIGMVYRNIDKMSEEELQLIQKQAAWYKAHADTL